MSQLPVAFSYAASVPQQQAAFKLSTLESGTIFAFQQLCATLRLPAKSPSMRKVLDSQTAGMMLEKTLL